MRRHTVIRRLLPFAVVLLSSSVFAAGGASPATAPAHAAASAPAPATLSNRASAWPSDSLHLLPVALEASTGERFTLADTAGRVRVVSMFYASCPMVCPMTIETIRQIERAIPPPARAKFGVILATVDPERDTPKALHALAVQRHVDDRKWRLARATPSDTRALAAALGIQYRALDNGDFNHSTVLVLLDAEGRPIARSTRIGTADPQFIETVRKALTSSPSSSQTTPTTPP